jgi:AraC family transcriptional regulator of adaptative response/methylated-DNA-[protein]-cysteine methyltransferase
MSETTSMDEPQMKPQPPRTAGRFLHVTTCDSSLGRVLVATGDAGIAAVLIGDDDAGLRADLQRRFPVVKLLPADARSREAATAVLAAIVPGTANGAQHPAPIPLDLRGTPFQRAVWTALRDIPRGATATYTEIAARVGRPSAVRAVAQACAANAHAVLVPCHRVVRSDGTLSGYRWGIERKRTLLREEGAVPR